jgi:hypothetical protein
MNKYLVQVLTNCVVDGQYNIVSYDITADKLEIVNEMIQFTTIDQIKNRAFISALFPVTNTIVRKIN